MKERPILFSAPMVKAILDGRKSQTRRVVDRDLWDDLEGGLPSEKQVIETDDTPMGGLQATRFCPYGQPGDQLWVRETWRLVPSLYVPVAEFKDGDQKAPEFNDLEKIPKDWKLKKWRPSIFMPRWASRITLEVTGVRVERVQEITEEDAAAEGADIPMNLPFPTRKIGFEVLWDSINAKRGYGWAVNPWCWCLTFGRVTP